MIRRMGAVALRFFRTGGEVAWMLRQFAIEDAALNEIQRALSHPGQPDLNPARSAARAAMKMIERNPRVFGLEPRWAECPVEDWPRWVAANEHKIATLGFYAHAFPERIEADAGESARIALVHNLRSVRV